MLEQQMETGKHITTRHLFSSKWGEKMLINNEKQTIERNKHLDGFWLIDEETEQGKTLAIKIREHYPCFDFVVDSEGNLIDIEPAERPDPEPPQPSEIDILKAQNKALVDRQEFLEDVIAEMAMMVYD